MTKTINVLMADDHAMVRDALCRLIEAEPDLHVVAIVQDAEAAVLAAQEHELDVVILDIDMPGLCCFEAARSIKRRDPQVQIIFLSGFFHDRYIEQALEVQASAYIAKGEAPETVLNAIRAVANGDVYFSPQVRSRIVIDADGVRPTQRAVTRMATLTDREVEVIRYLARGMSTKEIAQTMYISMRTVERHKANLMTKLNIHDRVELTRFAIREGLAEA